MKETTKQLKDLLGRFYEPRQAGQMASEIEQIESRIADFPSPQLRPERLQAIKNQCAAAMRSKRTYYLRIVSVAAACLLAASAMLLFRMNRVASHETSAFLAHDVQTWEEMLADDDRFITDVTDELDHIYDQLHWIQAAQWDQPAFWQQDLRELEDSDLITGTSFWKG